MYKNNSPLNIYKIKLVYLARTILSYEKLKSIKFLKLLLILLTNQKSVHKKLYSADESYFTNVCIIINNNVNTTLRDGYSKIIQ